MPEEYTELLKSKKLTVSTAESCTGGLLSASFTEIPGSSQYYLGSIIAYSNEVKTKLLGMPSSLIEEYGAVSEQVAEVMAQRIRMLTGSDIGIGITGIAGPEGETPGKPVGLVYIALATEEQSRVYPFHFKGARENIRNITVKTAQSLLNKYLKEIEWEKNQQE